jgi:hypothetical protein
MKVNVPQIQPGKLYAQNVVKPLDKLRSGRTGFDEFCCKYEIPKPILKKHLLGNVKRGAERNPTGSVYVTGTLLPPKTGDELVAPFL